jgi:signal transduction histidine kinase
VTERVQLERRMVATLERQQRRIGKNLHDRVGQQLAGTRMLAQNLAHRHFPDPEEPGRTMIDRIVRYVQEAIQHVNDLQRGVMPVQVDRDGLAQALAELSSRTGMHEDIQCTYEHDGHTDVEDHEIKLQLYRIAQEATRNAVLHAEPATIEVRLETNGDALLLQVKDDGTGFDDPGNTSTDAAFGLHSMRYRARAIGADLQIDTEPGRGTVVRCQLPVNAL